MAHSHDHNHQKGHDHGHDHSHGLGHSHGANAPHKILMIAIAVTFLFAIIEALGGWWANSLALLGDAGHMASDALALGIAAFAAWVAQKPPSSKHSYGLGRAEILAAWVSSLMLLIVSIVVIAEAIERIHSPEHVKGGTVVIIAFLGLIVNGFVAWMLARGDRTLNMRAALLHVMGDFLGSIAALIAGAVIYKTGWFPIDPILSILIGLLILFSSLRILRESLLILMEGVPGHIEYSDVLNKMQNTPEVQAIHDLHIWTLSSGIVALSAHIHIENLNHWENALTNLRKLLKHDYSIDHVTLQPELEHVECEPCPHPDEGQIV